MNFHHDQRLADLGLNLRAATRDDAPQMATILAHYVQTSVVTLDLSPPDARSFIDKLKAVADFGGPFIVLADPKDRAIGFAYGGQYRPKRGYDSSIELSIYLDPDWTAKGLGQPLLLSLCQACKTKGFRLAISVLTSDPRIGATHMPSAKLHQRCGFVLAGTLHNVARKFDQYWDTAMYTLDLDGIVAPAH